MDIWISRAESRWLSSLSSYAEELFSYTFLPSHDHTHHQRVWNISKNLLKEISLFHSKLDFSLVEGVLIAAWFHDLGMAKSTREDHGRLGRELCHNWLREHGRDSPELLTEILSSIEWHDNKTAGMYSAIRFNTRPGILSILSIADDLEALGTIGIYRYAEIYLMRNINLSELGSRVLENAEIRYNNLKKSCSACTNLLPKYKKQYQVLREFYTDYNSQLLQEIEPLKVYTGPLGVINYIRTRGMEEKIRPEYLSKHIAQEEKTVISYFKTLSNELDQARL